MDNSKVNRFSDLIDEEDDNEAKNSKLHKKVEATQGSSGQDKNKKNVETKSKESGSSEEQGKQRKGKKFDNTQSKNIKFEDVHQKITNIPQQRRFTGNNNPVHPYDRKSGTGRGKEDPKGGYHGWGNMKDDLRTMGKIEENEEDKKEGKKEEVKNEDKVKEETIKEEEKEKEPEIIPISYSEYLKQKEEKRKNLPVHKAIPKKEMNLEGLMESKKEAVPEKNIAFKSYKPPEEFYANSITSNEVVLGTYVESDKKSKKGRKDYPKKPFKGSQKEGSSQNSKPEKKEEKESKEVKVNQQTEKKFVVKDEDFPSL